MKTAIVIGATGLTGSLLVRLLLEDDRFSQVVVFVRRSIGINDPKLTEHRIHFDRPESWQDRVRGDLLFSCLGTTLKKAGSKKKQWKIDHTSQYLFAETAARNGVPGYVLISTAGADAGARNFYMRMKGKLEEDVKTLPFRQISIIRPGLLQGERNESRFGETAAEALLRLVNAVGLFQKYRPIPAATVAHAMVNASLRRGKGVKIYELDEVFDLAAKAQF